ncbi:hypothetical protein F7725_012493 [Dissostichus mawsoni]|uniref:Uncharacterized protein n=1 Tax=Dissostichus mawsoni TaxID=36200 RepID=A0A7J5YP35_DISMA|nr:hypothetical protein F7725_012493 [Dissostichus mawsoni]
MIPKRMRMRTPTTELQAMAIMAHTERPVLGSGSMADGTVVSRLMITSQVDQRAATGATLPPQNCPVSMRLYFSVLSFYARFGSKTRSYTILQRSSPNCLCGGNFFCEVGHQTLPERLTIWLDSRNRAVSTHEVWRGAARPSGDVSVRVAAHHPQPLPLTSLPPTVSSESLTTELLIQKSLDIPSRAFPITHL